MTLTMKRLDHVNLRTANLPAMVDWYERVLGLVSGPRPSFSFPGAWLYVGDHAIVHLVGQETQPTVDPSDLKLEHFAIEAEGLGEMLARAEADGQPATPRKVPGFPVVQVNLWDPDGNHIHVDFNAAEMDDLDG
ncbi:MAG: VOC family protein [Pseudomonadota bacterium]